MRVSIMIVLSIFCITHLGFAQTIDQERDQLVARDHYYLQIEKKKRILEEEERIFIGAMNELEKDLREVDDDIYHLSSNVARMGKNISSLDQSLSKTRDAIGERVRKRYLNSDLSYLSQSASLGEFLRRFHSVCKDVDRNQDQLKWYHAHKASLSEIRKKHKKVIAQLHKKKQYAYTLYEKLQKDSMKNKFREKSYQSKLCQLEIENQEVQLLIFNQMKKKILKAREREEEGQFRGFCWPVEKGVITSPFGERYHPIQGKRKMHRGVDIGSPLGSPIRAVADGRVIAARPARGYGYIVVIAHGRGCATLYGHMFGSTVKVREGEYIRKGQVLALVGTNGWSTGPHLHFEFIQDGQVKNPMIFFR